MNRKDLHLLAIAAAFLLSLGVVLWAFLEQSHSGSLQVLPFGFAGLFSAAVLLAYGMRTLGMFESGDAP